jgi:antitoxin (DNA-binding transcriptional repressor) of toxin-antitoxin stability system
MEASVVDLRYKMKDVLAALERREEIRIMYHGRVKGTITPVASSRKIKMTDHPFFGMGQSDSASVPATMEGLRKGRYDAL